MQSFELKLSNGGIALIDAEDKDRVLIYGNWYRHRSRKTFYAETKHRGVTLKLHRLIMDAPAGKVVDHKNLDGLDNRKENLRIITQSENKLNKRTYMNNSSGVKGVYPKGGKWAAQITARGEQFHLGTFDTIEEATLTRLQAEQKLHKL